MPLKEEETQQEMKRELGLLDATMLVVGSMIGSGIFIVSADITRNVGSAGWLIIIWILTGVITLMAALSYGELSAMFPKAGGQYVYLKEAYNKLIAFLYGWSFFMVIQTGTIAAVGVAFAKFAAYLYEPFSDQNILFNLGSFKINASQILAIVTIFLLTWINSRGVKNGKIIQTILTIVKILSLFGLIIAGLVFAFRENVWTTNWTNAFTPGQWTMNGSNMLQIGGTTLFAGVISAMVGSLFSSDAWNNVTFIAGEIKNPQKNIGLSLLLGTIIVTVIYVLANIMYTAILPMQEIAHAPADRVAVAASQYIFGSSGTILIALMIMISTFGCNNGLILSGARVYYTMAKDGLFLKQAAQLNKFEVPSWGLWTQCIWASALCLTGKYGDLLDYVIFVVLIFYILTIAGIFILRKTKPDAIRPYKAFGYPFIPALYIILAAILSLALLYYKTSTCGWGLLLVLTDIPVYYLSERYQKNKN
ncbi:APC family permease [Pedobacter punctiformis]|uniref:Amino acid permease n=1 Tax=Pedobacter punctiformis TaxID=3004097 RepID=A0ABT4LB06_9SPHI|nr:amino acid permease [Pedobacter sp. HCMS5-2]MCZ4245097.1 amino acid permease [Pedobacter sp. HCMS5-2]